MIDLRRICYFVVLAEELHFGRAAKRLGISQPPLSQQIRVLERELEVRLFARNNRRVELTPAGTALLPEARRLVAQAERTLAVARRAQLGELGELRIGFTPSSAFSSFFPQMILEFHRRFRDVHLTLHEMTTRQQVTAMIERRLDIGFIRSAGKPEAAPSLQLLHLFEDPLVVAVPSGHPLGKQQTPISIAVLAGEPFVMHPREAGTSAHDQIIDLCQRAGFVPHIVQEARETSTIVGLVATGLGVGIVPASLRNIKVKGVKYRPLQEKESRSSMWLALRGDRSSPQEEMFAILARSLGARFTR
jgi:DNA-binding transcriptional LysR family regulator